MNIRKPVVAGAFYPSDPEELAEVLESCYYHNLGPNKLPSSGIYTKPIGVISPHAGYIYSGPIAAHSFVSLSNYVSGEVTVIIIGPNHTGLGSDVAISDSIWEIPLGNFYPDIEFIEELCNNYNLAKIDNLAHSREHSIEVQLPFLKSIELLRNDVSFKIVPICIGNQDYSIAIELSKAIEKTYKKLNKNIVIISSTDFNHYEPYEIGYKKDAIVIKNIINLNEKGLYEDVILNNISMCGYGPTIVMINLIKRLVNEPKAYLLSYSTSGDITNDYSSVVGYGAILLK